MADLAHDGAISAAEAFCAKGALIRLLDAAVELGFLTKHRRIDVVVLLGERFSASWNEAPVPHR